MGTALTFTAIACVLVVLLVLVMPNRIRLLHVKPDPSTHDYYITIEVIPFCPLWKPYQQDLYGYYVWRDAKTGHRIDPFRGGTIQDILEAHLFRQGKKNI